ncbi:MAG: hypothetical protein ACYSUI_00585 [Planctomycetota bacterium]|jgi:hypothetical protein
MSDRTFSLGIAAWLAVAAFIIWCLVSALDGSPTETEADLLWAGVVAGAGLLGGVARLLQMRLLHRPIERRLQRGLRYEPLISAIVAVLVYAAFSTGQITIFEVPSPGEQAPPQLGRCLFLGIAAGYLWEVLLTRLREQVKNEAPSQREPAAF